MLDLQTGSNKNIRFRSAINGSFRVPSSATNLGGSIDFMRPSDGSDGIASIFVQNNNDLAFGSRSDTYFYSGTGAMTANMVIKDGGNLGIGTTSPLNPLHVIGGATFAGGVNASSLNVTGFCVAEDSLITLADGTKKKIKDIKEGEYVQSLDEKTGKIVSNS